jgi:hypothetical protein
MMAPRRSKLEILQIDNIMPNAGGEVRGEKYGLDIVLAVGRGINELTNRYVL